MVIVAEEDAVVRSGTTNDGGRERIREVAKGEIGFSCRLQPVDGGSGSR